MTSAPQVGADAGTRTVPRLLPAQSYVTSKEGTGNLNLQPEAQVPQGFSRPSVHDGSWVHCWKDHQKKSLQCN